MKHFHECRLYLVTQLFSASNAMVIATFNASLTCSGYHDLQPQIKGTGKVKTAFKVITSLQ